MLHCDLMVNFIFWPLFLVIWGSREVTAATVMASNKRGKWSEAKHAADIPFRKNIRQNLLLLFLVCLHVLHWVGVKGLEGLSIYIFLITEQGHRSSLLTGRVKKGWDCWGSVSQRVICFLSVCTSAPSSSVAGQQPPHPHTQLSIPLPPQPSLPLHVSKPGKAKIFKTILQLP